MSRVASPRAWYENVRSSSVTGSTLGWALKVSARTAPSKSSRPSVPSVSGSMTMRQVVFLQRIQPAGMKHRRRVAGAHVNVGNTRIVRIAVAIAPEQPATCGFLQLVALRMDPSADVVDLVILEAEHVDHALAIDEDVVRAPGGVLAVGAHFVQRAFETVAESHLASARGRECRTPCASARPSRDTTRCPGTERVRPWRSSSRARWRR